LKFAPMAISVMALLQQHDGRRDILIKPAAQRHAAIEARGHSELGAQSGLKTNRLVCLSVSNILQKPPKRICMKFSRKVGSGPMNKYLNFGGNPDHHLDTGIVSGFVTIGRYGKWLMDINLLLILICQMAALLRCALAELCTVPLLLVLFCFGFWVHPIFTKCHKTFIVLILICKL